MKEDSSDEMESEAKYSNEQTLRNERFFAVDRANFTVVRGNMGSRVTLFLPLLIIRHMVGSLTKTAASDAPCVTLEIFLWLPDVSRERC